MQEYAQNRTLIRLLYHKSNEVWKLNECCGVLLVAFCFCDRWHETAHFRLFWVLHYIYKVCCCTGIACLSSSKLGEPQPILFLQKDTFLWILSDSIEAKRWCGADRTPFATGKKQPLRLMEEEQGPCVFNEIVECLQSFNHVFDM